MFLIPWAARYNTWLLIKLTPKGVVFSHLFFSMFLIYKSINKHFLVTLLVLHWELLQQLPDDVLYTMKQRFSHTACMWYQSKRPKLCMATALGPTVHNAWCYSVGLNFIAALVLCTLEVSLSTLITEKPENEIHWASLFVYLACSTNKQGLTLSDF